jgi:hypothetical protein
VLGDPYATLAELKAYASIQKDTHDDLLADALTAASRGIELVCHRQFNTDAAATARVYRPLHSTLVKVEDFHTTTGLVVKTDSTGDGTFDTTWDAGDFEARPLNGVVSGQPGWPYYDLWSNGTRLFPKEHFASVEVTAGWGWAAVPTPVKQSTLMLAEEIYKQKDSPFGIAGMDNYGVVRVRENPAIMRKLAPYVRFPVAVA